MSDGICDECGTDNDATIEMIDALIARREEQAATIADLRERLRVVSGQLSDARDYAASALTCHNRDGALCQLCLDRLALFAADVCDAELGKENSNGS